jgi:hypothetical protein
MPERRVATLADAKRQVYWRRIIGWLLIGLSIIFLLLFFVKLLYIDLSYSVFADAWGPKLRHSIDLLLKNWAVLALLWRTIPPWRPARTLLTTPDSDWVSVMWLVMITMGASVFLLRSASARDAQIKEFDREMQREAWRQQARAAQGLAPDNHVTTTVIGQAILHQYPAPPESWSQTPRGIVILGLIVALIGGVILHYVEYGYFQVRWPSSR